MNDLERKRMEKLQTQILLARKRGDVDKVCRLQDAYRAAGFPVTKLGGTVKLTERPARAWGAT